MKITPEASELYCISVTDNCGTSQGSAQHLSLGFLDLHLDLITLANNILLVKHASFGPCRSYSQKLNLF